MTRKKIIIPRPNIIDPSSLTITGADEEIRTEEEETVKQSDPTLRGGLSVL